MSRRPLIKRPDPGLRWRIALPYVALILVATLGLTIYLSDQVRQVRLADLEAQLLGNARLLAESTAPLLQAGTDPETLDKLVRRLNLNDTDARAIQLAVQHQRTKARQHAHDPAQSPPDTCPHCGKPLHGEDKI